jgi:hypothetical protein
MSKNAFFFPSFSYKIREQEDRTSPAGKGAMILMGGEGSRERV